MRVLHFGWSDLAPGASSASYRLHESLRSEGVDSMMLVSNRSSGDPSVEGPREGWPQAWARFSERSEAYGKRLVDRALRGLDRKSGSGLGRDVSLSIFGSRLIGDIPRFVPDIVHLHWICGGLVRPESLRRLAAWPVVWTLHDMWPFAGNEHYVGASRRHETGYTRATKEPGRSGPDLARWVWGRKRRGLASLPSLTAVTASRWMASEARKSIIFQDRRVEMIHYPLDTEAFRPQPREEARKALDLAPNTKVILFGAVAATEDPRKGFSLLLEALRRVEADRSEPFNLVVFGADEGRLPLTAPTTFLGRVSGERLVAAYNAADVFVAPSRQEAFGQTAAEALACGTPVVAFDTGGLPDIVDPEVNGFLARPFETADLAACIRRVLAFDAHRAGAFGDAARDKAVREFHGPTQAKKHIGLYEELIESAPSDLWNSRGS